jgi:hypothetical protein
MLLAGEDEPVAIAPYEPGADEFGASLSPDGGWLAYMVQCDAPLGCARVQRFPPVPGSSIEIREVDTWVQFSPNSTQLVTSRAPALFFWPVAIEGGRIDVAAPSRRGLNGFQTAQDHRSFDLRGPDGQDLVMVVPAGAAVTDSQESGNDVAAISSQIDFFHDFLEVLKERVEPSGAR